MQAVRTNQGEERRQEGTALRAGALRSVVLRGLGDAATQGGIDPALAEACFREVGAE